MLRQRSVNTPSLFPCAAKVKVPQLGSEETNIELRVSTKTSPASALFKTHPTPEPVSKSYLKKISTDLTFSEDVVRDRCFHMLPYDEKYLYEALNPGDLVPPPRRMKIPPGRHDARGTSTKHMPCNLTKSYKPHLKPLKRKIMERAREMHQEALQRAALEEPSMEEGSSTGDDESLPGFFITESPRRSLTKKAPLKKVEDAPMVKRIEKESKPSKEAGEESEAVLPTKGNLLAKDVSKVVTAIKSKMKKRSKSATPREKEELTDEEVQKKWEKFVRKNYDWDAFALQEVSKNTARWIVLEKMPPGEERDKMRKLVDGWYGKQDSTDLLLADLGETGEREKEQEQLNKKPKKPWKKPEASLLAKVLDQNLVEPHAYDPYSDDNSAPFYRQPVGIRRNIKHAEKEDAATAKFAEFAKVLRSCPTGTINATADIMLDNRYEAPPPPTIRDHINPAIKDTFYDTDNMYQQEWLTGADQIYLIGGDNSKIIMTTNNKYQKKFQEQEPRDPDHWYALTENEKKKMGKSPRVSKVTKGLRRWKTLPDPADDSGEYNMVPPGFDPEYHRSPDPTTRRLTKQNAALMQVIDEWRQKWHLSGQLQDSTPNDLIRDMADIQSHVRLNAIATIAKAAEYRPPPQELGIPTYGEAPISTMSRQLPEKLLIAMECLLDDEVDRVKLASAITLYSLSRPSEKANKVLHKALESDVNVDRWAAAQCLAHEGICNSLVVGEIIRQLLDTEDTVKHERAIYLLGKLSIFSPLVHCMVAEQLNSSSWRHKVIACKILPTLHGTINKDVTNKLSDLMWNDWHEDVRKSAAQCLGKTSHGREVHDDLRERIVKGDDGTRLEAISKIGQLGIMTAKLLPVFLKCFEDEYISIRSEVCITCGNLAIKDEQVMDKLLQLATFDPIWKVKALAIQAMGQIGVITEEITETLLWAVRYEENPGVRAEACHTLMMLDMRTEEVAEVLQERFLVESSQLVRDEIAKTLEMFGISATEDMDMVAQIKNEVRKLCTKGNIAAQISLNESDDVKHDNLARMIYESEKELKENEEEKEPMMQRLRSMSQGSSRPSTPHPKIKIEDQTDSPAPSREGTVFTPTADEEITQILTREDTQESGRTTPLSPDQKSRPATGEGKSSKDEEKSKSETLERETSTADDSQSVMGDSSERELSDVTGEKTPDIDRPVSVVKFSKELQVEEIPARSQSILTPSKSAVEDLRNSRMSSMAGRASEVRAFSQDAIREREKINTEALKDYAGLDSRYYDMIQDLVRVDNTYQILTGQETEPEIVRQVTVISDPNKAFLTQADESFTVTEDEELEDTAQSSVSESTKLSGEHIKVIIDKAEKPDQLDDVK